MYPRLPVALAGRSLRLKCSEFIPTRRQVAEALSPQSFGFVPITSHVILLTYLGGPDQEGKHLVGEDHQESPVLAAAYQETGTAAHRWRQVAGKADLRVVGMARAFRWVREEEKAAYRVHLVLGELYRAKKKS